MVFLFFAHWSENISVANNVFRDIGLDAIQLNLVRSDGVISDNRISRYAMHNEEFQNFAMSIGAGDYRIFNNEVINDSNGTGKGIQFLNAFSGSMIFNNVIVNPRYHGLFIHQRTKYQSKLGYIIANNTIVNPELTGILYNSTITEVSGGDEELYDTQDDVVSWFANNAILSPGANYEDSGTWKIPMKIILTLITLVPEMVCSNTSPIISQRK